MAAANTKRRRNASAQRSQSALAPGLYVVATPIGNSRDITLRALDVLAGADVLACEDTRQTAKLLELHGIAGGGRLVSYHAHKEARETPRLLARLESGASIALVSDAGTPLLSDPGGRLVAAARGAGLPVFAVPGPSALTAALSVAGIETARFLFAGFLPTRAVARRGEIAKLREVDATLVFLEAPHRLAECLADLAAELGGSRAAAVARELTKLHEEVAHGSLEKLAARFASTPAKGEIVILVAPPEVPAPAGEELVDAALQCALAKASVKDAVEAVAAELALPRRQVYARALTLKASRDGKA